jgi:hypothetical protein
MVLVLEHDADILVDVMLEKMSRFGINYKVSKNNTTPKTGRIPQTDIESVESTIAELEAEIEKDPEMPKVEYLMNLYSKAVEYYSATNNPKFEIYKEKIHNTLVTPRMTEFLDTEGSRLEDDDEDVNSHVDPVISVEGDHDDEIRIVKRNSKDLSKAQKYKLSEEYARSPQKINDDKQNENNSEVSGVEDEENKIKTDDKNNEVSIKLNEVDNVSEVKKIEEVMSPQTKENEVHLETLGHQSESLKEDKKESVKIEQLTEEEVELKDHNEKPEPKREQENKDQQPELSEQLKNEQSKSKNEQKHELTEQLKNEQPEINNKQQESNLEIPSLEVKLNSEEKENKVQPKVKIELAEEEDVKIDYNDEEYLDDDDDE